MTIQSYDNRLLQAELQSPYSSTAFLPLRRRHEGEKKDGQDEETDDASEDEDREPKTRSRMKKVGGAPPQSAKGVLPMPARAPTAAVTGQGLIWIDISSWQTAGCWVPGGVYGQCPYQDPDNTVALQEIIKVSSIGMSHHLSFSLSLSLPVSLLVPPFSSYQFKAFERHLFNVIFSSSFLLLRWCDYFGAGGHVPVSQVPPKRASAQGQQASIRCPHQDYEDGGRNGTRIERQIDHFFSSP